MQSSHQFIGNTQEYFIEHTEKLVLFIQMPRIKNKGNIVYIYDHGRLIEQSPFIASQNILLYYIGWYIHYWKTLIKYFSRQEHVYVIGFHPIFFFGMAIQKLIRKVDFVFWIPDYFPGNNIFILIFEKLKKYYHDRIRYTAYLSDTINSMLNNGKVKNTPERKTIMWGVHPKKIKRNLNVKTFSILFVGVIKNNQGLEFFFSFLKTHKEYKVYIVGICEKSLFEKYIDMMKRYRIEKQVFFPNRFFSDSELNEISKKCQVAIALYDKDPSSPTMYTDPGKIKAYTELGLPLIMSDVSAIASYVRKFHCGEIVERNEHSIAKALVKMKKDYRKYMQGVQEFNKYFYYETYYEKKFEFLKNK